MTENNNNTVNENEKIKTVLGKFENNPELKKELGNLCAFFLGVFQNKQILFQMSLSKTIESDLMKLFQSYLNDRGLEDYLTPIEKMQLDILVNGILQPLPEEEIKNIMKQSEKIASEKRSKIKLLNNGL